MSGSDPAVLALEPTSVWHLFAGLSAVPRPSGREERARAWARGIAREHGLDSSEDAAGNVRIDVPATPGCERAPVTVLQGHLDMVCEKNAGTAHDFERDPIRLLIETDGGGAEEAGGGQASGRGLFVRADGTTLGADNGIGVAMALAAATAPGVVHGPLEILLTVDEEVGMSGAKRLEPGFLRGRMLINLDAGDDDTFFIGCAGGCDSTLEWTFAAESRASRPAGSAVFSITVGGLRGGHSGGDIHKNRANAITLLARVLGEVPGLALATLDGGSRRNAIPREAHALVSAPEDGFAALRESAEAAAREAFTECGEAQCTIEVARVDGEGGARFLPVPDSARVIAALIGIPNGVLGLDAATGIVETSNNLATIRTEPLGEDGFRIRAGCMSRSFSDARLRETARQIEAVGRLAGASVETGNFYPGWKPDPDAPLLALCRRVYVRLFAEEPKFTAVHAGLECGIIGRRFGGMERIALGAHITGAHSPDERVSVGSVQRIWTLLTGILAEIAQA